MVLEVPRSRSTESHLVRGSCGGHCCSNSQGVVQEPCTQSFGKILGEVNLWNVQKHGSNLTTTELTMNPPLLWASSCDMELTATLHREQYSSFLALSSSVSGLDGLEVSPAPETGAPDPDCSELALPVLQPGEDEEGGFRRGVGVGRRGHTEAMGKSRGGVGGVRGSVTQQRDEEDGERGGIKQLTLRRSAKPAAQQATFPKAKGFLFGGNFDRKPFEGDKTREYVLLSHPRCSEKVINCRVKDTTQTPVAPKLRLLILTRL
ncbi:hypothetical protein EYF80_032834 [Liparis tanakae]|uniref:Uncharacterized protein n=1 Tax=Liparis tanakae TaxID=230148 RepID=A0A4Z2GTS7_9TELE|nr:hypothetical protein EYF80_032834 [Liparis tanakae]